MNLIGMTYIYALVDPMTEHIRYIGKSDDPNEKYRTHLKPNKLKIKSHKNSWIISVLKHNMVPLLDIIDIIPKTEWSF